MPHQPPHPVSSARLCFGTVQLGMPYGAANRSGMPSLEEAQALVREALAGGVKLFDTAQAYGEAEARLGSMQATIAAHGAHIVTKLAPLQREAGESLSALATRVEQYIQASLSRLHLQKLDYVMLHRAEHIRLYDGCIWRCLRELQAQGLIGRLGVSVSSVDEAKLTLDTEGAACIQVPFNIVDTRLPKAGITAQFAKRDDMMVFARSPFLQGMLTQGALLWPVLAPHVARETGALLDEWVAKFGRASRADLCLAYSRAQGWVDVVVLGMESMPQLKHNISLFKTEALTPEQCEEILSRMHELPEAFLNPALWPRQEA